MLKQLFVSLIFFCCASSLAQEDVPKEVSSVIENDLMKLMSLEVETTSAMKRAQPINSTPASIFVLERQDIEISGYTRLPQLLKLLLGVDARRIDNNQWAISVRSAASRFNSNLLVMIDGKKISAPIINSIPWEALNYPIDDIERIELIRGPSGSLWGNSSNNGLLNIISRHSSDTLGTSIKASVGDEVTSLLEVRYGDNINDISSYRVFAGLVNGETSQTRFLNNLEIEPNDYTKGYHLGAQYDLQYAEKSAFKAQVLHSKNEDGIVERLINLENYGLIYNNNESNVESFNYNLRLDHSFDNGMKWYLQLNGNNAHWYVDKDKSDESTVALNSVVNLKLGDHFISAGGEIVNSDGTYVGASFDAELQALNKGFFIQDEISFLDDNLKITVGNRWDYMQLFKRWENSPSFRFNYQLDSNHSVWGAYSKGYRVMINTDRQQEFTILFPNVINSTPLVLNTDAENSIDYSVSSELGYRFNLDDFNINTSMYQTQLTSIYIGKISTGFVENIPAVINTLTNEGEATNQGLDVSVDWQLTPELNMLLGYSYFEYDLKELAPLEVSVTADDYVNSQIYTRTQWFISDSFSMQLLAKHIGEHKEFATPSYQIVDLSLNWNVINNLKLTVVGQNLTNSAFVEFSNDSEIFTASSALGRSMNFNLTYEF